MKSLFDPVVNMVIDLIDSQVGKVNQDTGGNIDVSFNNELPFLHV